MPRIGEVPFDADAVWAVTVRDLTDISAEEIFDLPIFDSFTPSGMAQPGSPASADNFGSWVEISADVGTGKRLIAINISCAANVARYAAEFEIGEGASGSEAAVARVAVGFQRTDITNSVVYLWKSLTDNARLSVRVRDGHASALGWNVVPQIA